MILDELVQLIAERAHGTRRFVLAIAGPPAAGKSTLAASIRKALPGRSAILGLDAFHFDDAILVARSQRDRKGAPATFDLDGYRRCLRTLVDEGGTDVAIPVFDRTLELSRNAAEIVPPSCNVLITEGNYLLLDDGDWPSLAPLFDLTVFVDVPKHVIRERILARWRDLGSSVHEAELRAETNDLPNAETVLRRSRPADITIHTG